MLTRKDFEILAKRRGYNVEHSIIDGEKYKEFDTNMAYELWCIANEHNKPLFERHEYVEWIEYLEKEGGEVNSRSALLLRSVLKYFN